MSGERKNKKRVRKMKEMSESMAGRWIDGEGSGETRGCSIF